MKDRHLETDSVTKISQNLRMQGGSNHLLGVPTSLLQRWNEHAGAKSIFTGGVVRIESTNSSIIAKAYPGEVSTLLPPAAVALLRRVGHSGRQFNPAFSRVEGGDRVPGERAVGPRGEPHGGFSLWPRGRLHRTCATLPTGCRRLGRWWWPQRRGRGGGRRGYVGWWRRLALG